MNPVMSFRGYCAAPLFWATMFGLAGHVSFHSLWDVNWAGPLCGSVGAALWVTHFAMMERERQHQWELDLGLKRLFTEEDPS